MKLLLASEAAEILRINPNRLYELAKQGTIPCVRFGRRVRFSEEELLAWIRNGGIKQDAGSLPSNPSSLGGR